MSWLCVRVFLVFMMRTMAASIWNCRSWNTLSFVFVFSSSCYQVTLWASAMKE